jgi:hypothetical protein
MALTLIDSLNVYTMHVSVTFRFRIGEIHIYRIICTASIEPSLTYILSYKILYFTHTLLRYSFSENINQNVYTYITPFRYKYLPFMTEK